MENMNFIPANNLPVAEGNEVEVLCLENGQMKRKPASGLGGGAYDIKVRIWADKWNEELGDIERKIEILEGDYATALAKINEDTPAIVRIIEDISACEGVPEDFVPGKFVADAPLDYINNMGNEVLLNEAYRFVIYPDNSVEFD